MEFPGKVGGTDRMAEHVGCNRTWFLREYLQPLKVQGKMYKFDKKSGGLVLCDPKVKEVYPRYFCEESVLDVIKANRIAAECANTYKKRDEHTGRVIKAEEVQLSIPQPIFLEPTLSPPEPISVSADPYVEIYDYMYSQPEEPIVVYKTGSMGNVATPTIDTVIVDAPPWVNLLIDSFERVYEVLADIRSDGRDRMDQNQEIINQNQEMLEIFNIARQNKSKEEE